MSHSLYLIGSKARGDDNARSDIDYVCIYDRARPILNLPANASVSHYSTGRMAWMVKNSKLFVKHVLSDGIPIVETKNHRQLLESFRINREILQGDLIQFVGYISRLGWIPDCRVGRRWACDYIYTIARNIVYLSNALEGHFHFGYNTSVSQFLSARNATDLLPSFLIIRSEKYQYRSSDTSASCIDIERLNEASKILTGGNVNLRIGGASDFFGINPHSYEFLRLVERAVINNEISDQRYLDKLQKHCDYYISLKRHAQSLTSKLRCTRCAVETS